MIVLDTNVISELWRVEPDPQVLAWIDAQMVETLYLSVVTVAELRFGLAVMPKGNGARTTRSDWSGRCYRRSPTAYSPLTWTPPGPKRS